MYQPCCLHLQPRQAKGTLIKQFTKPTVQVILSPSNVIRALQEIRVELLIPSVPGDFGTIVRGPDVAGEGGGPLEPPTALLAAVVQGGGVHTLKLKHN